MNLKDWEKMKAEMCGMTVCPDATLSGIVDGPWENGEGRREYRVVCQVHKVSMRVARWGIKKD